MRSLDSLRRAIGRRDTLRRRSGEQRGLALLLVLGVIGLTSLVIVALLGLTLTSARVTAAQTRSAEERRAADGALESAIGQMARSTLNNVCDAVPPGNEIAFPGVDGPIDVTTQCDFPGPGEVADTADGSSDPLGGPRVEIVGDAYGGTVTAPSNLAAAPTLIHTGGLPLPFRADVDVRRGAAVQSSGAGPALTSTGQYAQGDAPTGASGTDCGPLGPSGTAQTRIRDRDAEPECSSAAAAAIAPRTGTLFAPSDVLSDRTVGACASVMTFEEGRYDAVDTARLNELLGGGCPNATFHFEPGKYLFDVFDMSQPEEDRHALIIDDSTVRLIFGEALGDPATATFPRACDTTQPGASVQLTGRTAIRHRQGRVAICPAFNTATGTAYPALVQSDLAPSQPVLKTVDPPLPTELDVQKCNPNCTVTSTWTSTGNAPLSNAELQFQTIETLPVHLADRQVKVDVSGSVNCTTDWESIGRTNNLFTTLDLMALGSCKTALAGENQSIFEGATITLTHRYTPAGAECGFEGCIGLQINDLRLRSNVHLAEGSSASSATWTNPANALSGGGTAAVPVHGDNCVTYWPFWPFVFDSSAVDPVRGYQCRLDTPDQEHTIQLAGFDPAGTTALDPDDHVETLGVRINSLFDSPPHSWAAIQADEPTPKLRFTLSLPANAQRGPASCTVEHDGYSRSNIGIHVDLMSAGGTCRTYVDTVADLTGSSLTMSISTGCAWVSAFGSSSHVYEWGNPDRCFLALLPDLDRVALAVTTDSVPTSPRSDVAVDDAGGTSFNVQGDTLMPRADLDIHWRGTVTNMPIVSGNLSLKALGSRMDAGAEVGVVCCAPPSVVRVAAFVDGRVVAEAHVRVGPPSSSGGKRSLSVLDWNLCSGSCTSVLGATTIPG